jgi:hypothetical protein
MTAPFVSSFLSRVFRGETTRTPSSCTSNINTTSELSQLPHTGISASSKDVVHKPKRLTSIGAFYTVIGMLHVPRAR